MNSKATRKGLNDAFKQFQRLPDWALVKRIAERALSRENGKWDGYELLRPREAAVDASGAQTLTE